MSFKSNGRMRDPRKIMCSIVFLIFTLIFGGSMVVTGFSMTKTIFGLICLYLSTAFFRTSNE